MGLNVSKLLADLERMTGTELRRRYAEVFGEESRSGNRQWLIRRRVLPPAAARSDSRALWLTHPAR